MHVLWKCPPTNDIWTKAGSRIQKWSRSEIEFMMLWERLMQKMSKEELEVMAVLFRKVWMRRNVFVFEKKILCPKVVLKTTTEALLEFKNAQSIQKNEKQVQDAAKGLSKWEKPGCGLVKVIWGAYLDVKERRMGVGIIIRDEDGEGLVAVCDQMRNVENPVVAECYALRMALELCSELNIHNAIFEGDAKKVIVAVQRDEEEMSFFGSLVEDVKFFFNRNADWQLQFAYRENNTLAHSLARTTLCLLEKTVWIEEMPDFIGRGMAIDKHCNV